MAKHRPVNADEGVISHPSLHEWLAHMPTTLLFLYIFSIVFSIEILVVYALPYLLPVKHDTLLEVLLDALLLAVVWVLLLQICFKNRTSYAEIAINTTSEGYWVIDRNGRFLEVNPGYCQMVGFGRTEILTMHVADLEAHASVEDIEIRLEYSVAHRFGRFETRHRHRDGHCIDIEMTVSYLPQFCCFIALLHDITERKQSELELNLAHTACNIAFFELSSKGQVESVNDFACSSLGYCRDELIGMHVWDFNPDFTQEDWYSAWAKLKVIGFMNASEFRHQRKDGSIFPIEAYSNYVVSNGVEHAFIFVEDITQRKQINDDIRKKAAFLEALVNTSSDGILVVDTMGKKILQNQQAIELWKVPKAVLENSDDKLQIQFVKNQTVDPKKFVDKVLYLYAHPEALSQDEVMLKDGTVLDRYSAPVIDGDGHHYGRIWSFRDITERKKAMQELQIAATVFESQEGMIVTDSNGLILRVNKAFTTITGYSAEEVIGRNPNLLSSGRQGKDFYAAMWQSLNERGAWEGEIWNRRKSGEIYPEHLAITAVKGLSGVVTHYVATLTDITMSKVASDEIKNLAFYDPLTQLPNRRLLLDRLKHALITNLRRSSHGALLFIDLDHFKTINDTLGHNLGDMLLQHVAKRLVTCVREGDTVARIGGDEFVVLLENLNEQLFDAAAQTELIGNKIMALLNQPYLLETHRYLSTASIGATLFNGNQLNEEEMLRQADIAMYDAKEAGRNKLHFFDPVMQDKINYRADLESDLRNALENNEFQLYYQVQVDSAGHAFGAEALIRWHHPERGLVPPFDFIPLAEESRLILPLGLWILETACAQLKAWEQSALTCSISVSINVSAKQMHQTGFVAQVQEAIQRHAINPTMLKLELTESMLVDDIENIIASMMALKAIGVRFELDDFGTGYSSLQYLKKLPLYQLKIDQSFVRDLASESNDQAIVRTIIAMAESLKLEVIAEGVETEDQLSHLRNYGCNHFQGYLFGKPMPIEEFEAALMHEKLL